MPRYERPPEPLEPEEGESDPRLAAEPADEAVGRPAREAALEDEPFDEDEEEADASDADDAEDAGEGWWDLTRFLLCVLAVALVIRTLLFQPYNIPSGSMESTLLVGDYVFVEKFAYGFSKYSFPLGRHLPSFGRVLFSPPTRGDVVVFSPPNDPTTVFIKRLVGLPGDRIRMTGGVLYIDDRPMPKMRVSDYVESDAGYQHHVARYRETLPGGKSYFVLDSDPAGPADDTGTYVVPPGHYFMMGDNRDDSNDSRMDVGYVPAENLVGKAQIRFFSIDGEKANLWKFWTWPDAIRFERMFTAID